MGRRWPFLWTLVLIFVVLSGCLPQSVTVPNAPTNLAASDGVFPDKVRITWDAVANTEVYKVYRAGNEEGPYEEIASTSATFYDDGSVTPGVIYWYKVKACNGAGCSELSEPDSGYAQPPTGELPPPANVAASDGDYPDKIRVIWDAVPGAMRYQVLRASSATGIYALRSVVTTNSFDDWNVVPGDIYWYKIRACNDAGCSVESSADSGYARAEVPPPPSGVSASDGTYSDRVRVTWNPVAGADYYEVHRADSESGPFGKIAEVTGTSYEDRMVGLRVRYWYGVKACNANGCSGLSDVDSGYADLQEGGGGGGGGGGTVPGIPASISATQGDYEGKIRVSWSSVTGAAVYQVFRSDTEGGLYSQIAETASTSYDDTGSVNPCKSYWYKVRACNENGCGDFSAPAEGWCDTRVTDAPADIQATDGTELDGVHLQWNKVEGADKYEIYRSTSPTGGFTCIYGCKSGEVQTASQYIDTSAIPGTTYWYRVRGCSEYAECGCGGLSRPESGWRSCTPPSPEMKSATLQADGTVSVEWNAADMPGDLPLEYEVSKYALYRATAEDGPYTFVMEVTTTQATDDPPDPGVGEKVTYYYKVKAYSTVCGWGLLSEKAVSVTIQG